MSTLYVVAFIGVCAVVLGVMVEAVRNVSRKPVWSAPFPVYERVEHLLVKPVEALPVDPRHSGFVGLSNEPEFQLTA